MIEHWQKEERIGIFGQDGHCVIVVHGGPGAYGGSDPVAKELSKTFRTYAPWQRRSGDVRLSVDIHVEDLKQLIEVKFPDKQPAIVGESWGAMLALAFASKYPKMCNCLALVGCGSFSEEVRQELSKRRQERIRNHIAKHPEFASDLQLPVLEQVLKWHDMTDTFARIGYAKPAGPEGEFDRQAFDETWSDMVRCQKERIYPDAFVNISCPVIMIHGDYDPHPGKITADYLKAYIHQLEYKELSKCGHAPDIEKYARNEFYEFLIQWLKEKIYFRKDIDYIIQE
jgi:pimeloyl-ACP methyl ester carboxylesterase